MFDGLGLSYPDSLKVELEKLDQQKNLASEKVTPI